MAALPRGDIQLMVATAAMRPGLKETTYCVPVFPGLLYTLATNIFILNVFLIRCACTRHRHSYRMQHNVPFYRSGSQPDSPVLPAFKSQSNRKTRSHEKQLKHNHSFSHLK